MLSFDNVEFTRTIIFIIGKGIKKSYNIESVTAYLEILETLLYVNDSLLRQKFEWLFGFPEPHVTD